VRIATFGWLVLLDSLTSSLGWGSNHKRLGSWSTLRTYDLAYEVGCRMVRNENESMVRWLQG
jgi:hypothetical protein